MIRNWLRNFMIGRYGPDQLYWVFFIPAVILAALAGIPSLFFLRYISYALIIIALYRMLSRNIPRRRRENDRFLSIWWPVKTKIKNFFKRLRDRKHYHFFKCPSCKNTLRVPRGKGKIQITCPKCGERFIRKS